MNSNLGKTEEPNVLGFNSFIAQDGNRHYGCRGIGADYDEFYDKFLVGKSYKSTSEDWPWDYFIFLDINDEQLFLEKYSNLIYYSTDSEHPII